MIYNYIFIISSAVTGICFDIGKGGGSLTSGVSEKGRKKPTSCIL